MPGMPRRNNNSVLFSGLSGKPRFFLCPMVFAVFFFSNPAVHGRPAPEKPAAIAMKNEWVLCVAALDSSELSPIERSIAASLGLSLLAAVRAQPSRSRSDEEISVLKDLSWAEVKKAAGTRLAAKRSERDALLYQGLPEWKYAQELEKIETAIADLNRELKKAQETPPEVASLPKVVLAKANQDNQLPPPPGPGAERSYAKKHQADALLTGSVRIFHGRYLVDVRIFDLAQRRYIHEDRTLFSPEIREAAMDDFSRRLGQAISALPLGSLRVQAEPPEALLVLDGVYAGRGSLGPLDKNPGGQELQAHAPGYESSISKIDIREGETASVQLNLRPLAQESLRVATRPEGAALYRGVLFIGNSPLTVPIRRGIPIVLRGEDDFGFNAQAAVFDGGGELRMELLPRELPGSRPVETARRSFYGAYGRFWIALPVAFLVNGLSKTYIDAANHSGKIAVYDDAYRSYYLSLGAWAVAGGFLAESIYRFARYLYTSDTRSIPVLKPTEQGLTEAEG